MHPSAAELVNQLARVYAEAVVDALLATAAACDADWRTGAGSAPSSVNCGEATRYAASQSTATVGGGTAAAPQDCANVTAIADGEFTAPGVSAAGTGVGETRAHRSTGESVTDRSRATEPLPAIMPDKLRLQASL